MSHAVLGPTACQEILFLLPCALVSMRQLGLSGVGVAAASPRAVTEVSHRLPLPYGTGSGHTVETLVSELHAVFCCRS